MNNPYYILWSDAIQRFKKYNPEKEWKLRLFIFITGLNGLNLWIVFLWLKYFDIFTIPNYNIDIFPGELLDNFVVFSAQFALPFAILNYFLIFNKNRYEKVLKRYKTIKGSYAPTYTFSVAILAFISAIIYGLLT
jgi:hypothetical protein